jgi:hypothetical protein
MGLPSPPRGEGRVRGHIPIFSHLQGMKGRGISNLKEFFNSSPSPYPLPSRERGNYLIFSHLPPSRRSLPPLPRGEKEESSIENIQKSSPSFEKGGREGFLSLLFQKTKLI